MMGDKWDTVLGGASSVATNSGRSRPSTSLTEMESSWKAPPRARRRPGRVPGKTAAERRALAKKRAGKTLTTEDRILIKRATRRVE